MSDNPNYPCTHWISPKIWLEMVLEYEPRVWIHVLPLLIIRDPRCCFGFWAEGRRRRSKGVCETVLVVSRFGVFDILDESDD